MSYPTMPDFGRRVEQLELYMQLKSDYGATGIEAVLARAEQALQAAVEELMALPADPDLAAREPSELPAILELRPDGPRRLGQTIDDATYGERLAGALLGRMAGCTLGAPVEGWPIEKMAALADANGQAFPPREYWTSVPDPERKRYGISTRGDYTRDRMNGVPVDDDIAYTLLGLLVLEDFGPGFDVNDVAAAWRRYLPYACTAERVALRNLRNGVAPEQAAAIDNPYCEWIGADIRADPWGYMAPGWPEKAADMAWRDAYLSHRRQGIYGEMFFAAAIAAAFTVDDPVDALRIGLTEIPRDCALAKAVSWALDIAPQIDDYRAARAAVDKRFAGMHPVHTINNACLTAWGLTIGGTDVTRVIAETVAMGLDNDCTAATAGSIAGAVAGRTGIDEHWYKPFGNTVHSYLNEHRHFAITDLIERFARQARRVVQK